MEKFHPFRQVKERLAAVGGSCRFDCIGGGGRDRFFHNGGSSCRDFGR